MLRCIVCKSYSFDIICNSCQINYLKPTITKRVIDKDFEVISFYKYGDIAPLIKTKHKFIGSFVYKILANNSFKIFAKEFSTKDQNTIYALSIDDNVDSGYSHAAILAKALKSETIIHTCNKLKAKNSINYSGKTLEYRLSHPREFEYSFERGVDVIIVDDIITTGTTIKEAKSVIEKSGANPLFALTLADANDK